MLDYTHTGTAKVKVEYVGRAPLDGHDDQYLMASYRPGNRAPDPSDGLPTGVMIAMNGPTPSADVGGPWPSRACCRMLLPPQARTLSARLPLPAFGPIAPERPALGLPFETRIDLASLSYAETRIRRRLGPLPRSNDATMPADESWKRRTGCQRRVSAASLYRRRLVHRGGRGRAACRRSPPSARPRSKSPRSTDDLVRRQLTPTAALDRRHARGGVVAWRAGRHHRPRLTAASPLHTQSVRFFEPALLISAAKADSFRPVSPPTMQDIAFNGNTRILAIIALLMFCARAPGRGAGARTALRDQGQAGLHDRCRDRHDPVFEGRRQAHPAGLARQADDDGSGVPRAQVGRCRWTTRSRSARTPGGQAARSPAARPCSPS